jgi:two-component system sensor histidine kinase/response regulator
VRDSGVGIPSNKIEALLCFQSNFNTPGTNNEKGSGLGLRICNDFVTVHGGRFWVESQANEGSCFYFTLPA